jgi:hypothetical protein
MKIVIHSDNIFYSTKDSTGTLWIHNILCCLCKFDFHDCPSDYCTNLKNYITF